MRPFAPTTLAAACLSLGAHPLTTPAMGLSAALSHPMAQGAALGQGSSELPVGFMESFALAEDRESLLGELLPGTDAHRYFTSLVLQQKGDLDAVDRILSEWKDPKRGRAASLVQIETRQALLRASTDPETTYKYLEKELGITFKDRRTVAGASPDVPTSLDPALVSTETLLQDVLRRRSGSSLKGVTSEVLETLVQRPLTDGQRRRLLDALPRPDVPGLMQLIVRDFEEDKTLSFGGRQIHTKLTLAQLEELRGARPEMLSNNEYVKTVMRRLKPRFPESMDDPQDQRRYFDRAWDFASQTPPAFNSLKAHVLYHRLVFDLDQGELDIERVVRYLRLPRSSRYYKPQRKNEPNRANLNESFQGATPFEAIRVEEPIVSEILRELFKTTDSYDPLLGVLEEQYLKTTFAESKLLYGDPNKADEYIKMLGIARAEALRERVDIEFARTNPSDYGASDDVVLEVDVKNVDRLLVKVFEIDPVAYFDRFGQSVRSNLDLDGLVAGESQVLEFNESPLRRVRRSIELDALKKPGTYVVELIGGGVSSRAVIVKGNLHLLERMTAAGHMLRVLDGNRQPVDGAIVRFGGRDYEPDVEGRILVPYTPTPSTKQVLLRAGGVSSVSNLIHRGEVYRLNAGIQTPREALLAGMEAELVVRPALTVNGRRVALGTLEDPALVITGRTLDGDVTTKVIDNLELSETGDLIQRIRVPERLVSLDVVMTATVRSLTEGSDVKLTTEPRSFTVNTAHPDAPFHALLSQTPLGYSIEVLGRAGEPSTDTEITVEVNHRFFSGSKSFRLKTDSSGRVNLGFLPDIDAVRVTSSEGVGNLWELSQRGIYGVSKVLTGRAGGELRVPIQADEASISRSVASLLQVDEDRNPLSDHFDALRLEGGYLVLSGLAPGRYFLEVKSSRTRYEVSILEGEAHFGHLVGENLALDVTDTVPLQIQRVGQEEGFLTVSLGGASTGARVHVIATRYVDPFDPAQALALAGPRARRMSKLGGLFSTYESGRAISDEYRYILDRRQIEAYPGNMLGRPGFLLNPWSLRATDDAMADAGRVGGRFGGSRNLRAAGRADSAAAKESGWDAGSTPRYVPDFLATGAIVLTDLRPDEDGLVRIPIGDLGTKEIIQIVAVDDYVTATERVVRERSELETRERRLVDPLDPQDPMTQQRRIVFLETGEELVIRDAPNAGAKTFGSLGDVYQYFRASDQFGAGLADFEFLTRWPDLGDEEKRAKYSEFACHELHAFLRQKDPEFFTSVVAPYLVNKGHRTFMDDWVLGVDLAEYLEPWRFDTLNVVEQILLLQSRGEGAARIVADKLNALPPKTFSLDESFGTVLAVGGLDEDMKSLGQALNEVAALERKRKSAARSRVGSGVGGGGGGPTSPGPEGPTSPSRGAISGGEASSEVFFLGRGEADQIAGAPEMALDKDLEEVVELGLELRGLEDGVLRDQAEGFYFRDLSSTEEYAETHYWRTPLGRMNGSLVTVSPFWLDFAKAGADGTFASPSFPLANRSLNEMLLALAFLDLPFEAAEETIAVDGRSVTMTAGSPMLVALEDIADAAPSADAPNVLVGQDFFDPARRTVRVDGQERERFVTDEFLKGTPYGCRMVVSNPSSNPVEMKLLIQIPEGAIPLGSTQMTDGVPVSLAGYGTQSIETFFYFPEPGTFQDYPVHAGAGSVLLGAAEPMTLKVVAEPTNVDKSTWEWISQNGELSDVLAFIEDGNPQTLGLDRLAWRMSDQGAFVALTDALASRGLYPESLWRYGIKHRMDDRAGRYLSMREDLIERVGAPFRSPLLQVDARDRGLYEHLAYEPLVNGRTHEFGGERKILNAQFKDQYQRFMEGLVLDAEPRDPETSVELSYYLLLQDRIGEALGVFRGIDRDALGTKIQYDYMTAYMAFFESDLARARQVATQYAEHPVTRWRDRFRNVLAQVDQIEGVGGGDVVDPDDREQSQGALAGREPLLNVDVDGGQLVVGAEFIDELEVRYHRMDVEFLFSNSPFVRGGEGAFGLVKPSRRDVVQVPEGQKVMTLDLPEELRTANFVVEVRGGGVSAQTTYFAGELKVQGMERYGQIKVVAGADGAALPKAYVKVYAMLANGQTRFHKDGYTDLRGRFDYVSLSGVTGPDATSYALLVMHDEAGASMLELSPPSR